MDIKKLLEDTLAGVKIIEVKKPEIKEYYIAYFDILGYKSYLADYPEKAQEMLNRVTNAFDFTINRSNLYNDLLKVLLDPTFEIKCKAFSDNVTICLDAENMTPMKLITFLHQIKEIQLFFLQQGFFVRGVVAKGEAAISEQFVFGKGLVDVVEMECSENCPRINIDKSIIDDIRTPIKFRELDEIALKELKELVGEDPLNTEGVEIVRRVNKSIRIINNVLCEASYVLDDTTETEQLRTALWEEYYKLIDKGVDGTFKELLVLYLTHQRYLSLIIRLGEVIINKSTNDMINSLNAQYYAVVATEEKTEKTFINYLCPPQFDSFFEAKDIEKIISNIESVLGSDMLLVKEAVGYLRGEKNIDFVREVLEHHKKLIIENVRKVCTLEGVDINNPDKDKVAKSINARIRLQQKYQWLKIYHNQTAEIYGVTDLKISCKGNKDEKTDICILQEIV